MNVTDMLDRFITPIKMQGGIEALRDTVTETERQVQAGMLYSPRDIEVFLLFNGKVGRSS